MKSFLRLAPLALCLIVSPPAQGAPETPPYDLRADLERRKAEALEEFGRGVATEVVERVFLLVLPAGRAALRGTLDFTRRVLAAYFNERFSKQPDRAISVYLFPAAAPYQAHCRKRHGAPCISPFGFYSPVDRTIVMNIGPGAGTLSHELVHPIVETDFPDAPTWLNEGIASLFEAPTLPRPGEIHGGKNWRWPRLNRALASKRERNGAVPAALFGMSDEAFRDEQEPLHYATARYFCQWLDSKNWLWPFYRTWRDRYQRDPTGAMAFESVTGAAPAAFEAEWIAWVRRL